MAEHNELPLIRLADVDPRSREIGRRIRCRRKELGLSTKDAAQALGIPVSRYQGWEVYLSAALELQYQDALCKLLRVSPLWLSYGVEVPESQPAQKKQRPRRGRGRYVDVAGLAFPPVLPDTIEPVGPTEAEREAMGARAKARRKELKLRGTRLAASLHVAPGTLAAAETQLRWQPATYEAAWEAALLVPPGWLRDLTMESPPYIPPAAPPPPPTVLEEILQFARTDRQRSFLRARYGRPSTGDTVPSFRTLAMQLGVSAAAVSARVLNLSRRAASRGDLKQTPLLNKLFLDLKAYCPETPERLNQRAANLLGPDLTVQGLIAFSEDFLKRPGLRLVRALPDQPVSPWVVTGPDYDLHQFSVLRETCLGIQRVSGAVQLGHATGLASRALGHALSLADALNICQLTLPVEWLDEAAGWFWCGPTEKNRVTNVVHKLLAAAAPEGVHTEEAIAALSHRAWPQIRQSPRYLPPPYDVVIQLIRRLPGLSLRRQLIRAQEPRLIEDALSATERCVLEYMRNQGGVCSRAELAALQLPRPNQGLTATLQCSPILRRLEPGIYVLRGARLDPEGLVRARSNNRQASVASEEDAGSD